MSAKLTKEEFINKYLKEGVPFNSRIRGMLLSLGIKEDKCENCGITEWLDKPIQIQVHHINGNRNDNRIENLQMLCPNCHAQTENYQAKNTYIYAPRDKACANCGKFFVAKSDDQKFCSTKCLKEYRSKHQREYESPYTKEFLLELCQKYNTLNEIGFIIHKSKETVKRNLIQHGLFEDFIRKRNLKCTPVLQYDTNGRFIKEWPSITDAQETLNICHIGLVCKGQRGSAGGFIWKYKDVDTNFVENSTKDNPENNLPSAPNILQYNLSGAFIREFSTIDEAAKVTNTNRSSIVSCLQGRHKQANNYIWKYKEEKVLLNIAVADIGRVCKTPVLMYNTQGDILNEFNSIQEASKSTGIRYSNICQCLRGSTQSAGGFIWRYKNYMRKSLSEEMLNRPIPTKLFKSKVPVLQYTLKGDFVREFESIAEASAETGVRNTTIEKCLNGDCDRAGDFIWKRKDQENVSLVIPPYNPKPKRSKPVLQYDRHGNLVKKYSTIEEVLATNNISRGTLMKCLVSEKMSFGGYVWRNKENAVPQNIDVSNIDFRPKRNIPVIKCDLQGNILEEYPSVCIASKETGISRTHINNSISGHCRKIDNFIWKYK